MTLSLLFIFESLCELICLVTAITLLYIARNIDNDRPLSPRFTKARKYMGFSIALIMLTGFLNYSYIFYRYVFPPNPYDLIGVEKYLKDDCVRVIK